ncbi:DUF6493 family protein [Flavobacterium sp. 3-210]
MDIHKELLVLIKNEKINDLDLLLKKLDKEQRAVVTQKIKSYQYKFKIENSGNLSVVQNMMLMMCKFICYDKETADKLKNYYDIELFQFFHIDLLEKYCPEWFSDFINRTAVKNPVNYSLCVTYEQIIEWTKRGFLVPSSDLIARAVSQLIYEVDAQTPYSGYGKISHYFTPENLLKNTITLEEHIWCLFKSPSDINNRSPFIWVKNADNNKANWLEVFKQFTLEGKLNRGRVLKESLLATNRNLNKTLTDWFVRLFNEMQPTNLELLNLQNELFVTLNSQNSSAINNGLNKLIEIIDHKSFDTDKLKCLLPVLLSSTIKSVANKAKTIENKLQSKKP